MAALQSPPDREQPGPILEAVLEARAASSEAMHDGALRTTVDALVVQARLLGATRVFGASEIGHALAGAMAYAAPDVEIWIPGSRVEYVLLIDGALASAAGPRWHMEIAVATGARRADALVLSVSDRPVSGREDENGRIVELPRLQLAA